MIPNQLQSDTPTFLRLARRSKAPERGNSASDGPFFCADDSEIVRHLAQDGNVGRVLRDNLVAFDVDHSRLADTLVSYLGSTFSIRSGGDGFGEHWYYDAPNWEGNQTEISTDQQNIGSLRSGNSYCLVPPSIHDETGDQYRLESDQSVTSVTVSELKSVLSEYQSQTANTGGSGGGGAASGVGGASAPVPEEYPNRDANWQTVRSWLAQNGLLDRLDQNGSADWSGDEFAVGKCLAEGGFSESVIYEVLSRFHPNAKWHRRDENYRKLTVQKVIESAVDDPHVEFSNSGDMGADASESRKTEESGSGRTLSGGDNTMNYDTKDTLVHYQADSPSEAEDGDRVVRVELTNMNGQGDNGDRVDQDFVSFEKGTLREDGEFGVSPQFSGDPQSSKSVGSADPEDLRLIAESLEKMADQIE